MPDVKDFSTAKAHETNIERVVQLEAEQERKVPAANRLSEAIGGFAGTTGFVLVQIVFVGLWLTLNSGGMISPFDPYPYVFLGVAGSGGGASHVICSDSPEPHEREGRSTWSS